MISPDTATDRSSVLSPPPWADSTPPEPARSPSEFTVLSRDGSSGTDSWSVTSAASADALAPSTTPDPPVSTGDVAASSGCEAVVVPVETGGSAAVSRAARASSAVSRSAVSGVCSMAASSACAGSEAPARRVTASFSALYPRPASSRTKREGVSSDTDSAKSRHLKRMPEKAPMSGYSTDSEG